LADPRRTSFSCEETVTARRISVVVTGRADTDLLDAIEVDALDRVGGLEGKRQINRDFLRARSGLFCWDRCDDLASVVVGFDWAARGSERSLANSESADLNGGLRLVDS
jgi:hypothetical protein